MLRYVVLHHTGIENPHFDLMVELSPGSKLSTWRVLHWPPLKDDQFTPLAGHRRDYLEYEGPVSGNRGEVRRVAAGHCNVVGHATHLLLRLEDGSECLLPPTEV